MYRKTLAILRRKLRNEEYAVKLKEETVKRKTEIIKMLERLQQKLITDANFNIERFREHVEDIHDESDNKYELCADYVIECKLIDIIEAKRTGFQKQLSRDRTRVIKSQKYVAKLRKYIHDLVKEGRTLGCLQRRKYIGL